MTRKYIGTKIVTAYPQEKDGKPGYGVIYADGYTSWSPKEVFEESYHRAIERDGQALNSAMRCTCSSLEKESGARRLEREGHVPVHCSGIDLQGQPSAASWNLPGRNRDQLLPTHRHEDSWTGK